MNEEFIDRTHCWVWG